MGLSMAGAAGIDAKLALRLLRTEIGHALIPIAHPAMIAFNLVFVLIRRTIFIGSIVLIIARMRRNPFLKGARW